MGVLEEAGMVGGDIDRRGDWRKKMRKRRSNWRKDGGEIVGRREKGI